MHKITASAGLALALMLAGCEEGTPEPETANVQVPEGDYQQELQAMPDAQRNATFFRAISDAGRDCQQVVGSTQSGDLNGRPTWTARCRSGVDWLIIIGKDGLVQVVSREEAEAMGLPRVNPSGATNQTQ